MSLKRDKICPQCENRKLWYVEQVQVPAQVGARPMAVSIESTWATRSGFRQPQHQGEFESYICAKCGFTEWYATRLDELKADPGAGVYFIDDEPKAGLR